MNLDKINELFIRLKNKDLTAFDEFYNLTNKYIFYNIVKIVDDFADAEDMLQDTYLYFLNKVHSISDKSSPIGYLLITAKHKSIDFMRKRKRVINDEEYINFHYFEEFEPIKEDVFLKIKDLLPKDELEIVILHVINQMTFKEIAILNNIPLGTVLWKYNKTIKYLKEELNIDDYRWWNKRIQY